MRVSFIIPHKGREEMLERTIQSIRDQEFDPKMIEVIVVTQNTSLHCSAIQFDDIQFTAIFRPATDTISALRNQGVTHASGEYLAFLDADIQLSPDWLKVMFHELEINPGRLLVSAIQRCEITAGMLEQTRVILNNASADSAVQFLDGRNLFMKRETFTEAGGFPEHLVTCEDYYFTNKIHLRGEVYFTSKTSYIHLGEDKTYTEMFRKEIWRGQSNLQSLRGRKIPLREIPSLIVPLWEVGSFLAAAVGFMSGHIMIGSVFLLLFCFPILVYAIRLYKLGLSRIRFIDALWFYCVYFPARTIGTIQGIFRQINYGQTRRT